MLYVFMVSCSMMKKFHMELALKNVIELKAAIEKSLKIPVEDQVLLCSGGEELKPQCRVADYGAGTDTNPIFLFSKYTTEAEIPFPSYIRASSDLNIEYDVQGCVDMAPSCEAATVRFTLAQKFAELAVNEKKECDDLVHGQHLQQQGWAAVIANLDDAKESLLKHKAHFEDIFQKYLDNRSIYQEILKTFPHDIELLARIPLLPKLVLGIEQLDDHAEETDHTLLSWFCSEPRHVLESLAEKCQRSLEELNENSLIALNSEVNSVLMKVDNPDVKEVKGIEERLFQLNKLIDEAKKHEKDQHDIANWFNNNLDRMINDHLILVQMSGTCQQNLEMMQGNHKCLRDILDRCTKAKVELCETIHIRLKYICKVESEMYNLQVRLTFYEKHVKSVVNQIESFQQVHVAPQRYLKMLAEVCRRKSFSTGFLQWASELSAQTHKLYEKEISIRSGFSSEESKNIVDDLFPGMEDVPPPFAIECPRAFDQLLPDIKREDLELFKTNFPELANFCEVPPSEQMPYICHRSAESDSAFDSNVPSCPVVGDIAVSTGGLLQPHKGESRVSSAHKSSVLSPGESASHLNELCSLTSSPFEDCLLPSSESDALKRTKSPSENVGGSAVATDAKDGLSVPKIGATTVDSDGEEFENVDQYETASPTNAPDCFEAKQTSYRPTSSSVIVVNKNKGDYGAVSKAHSDGDALSPAEERLRSPDSLLTSQDFQSTEYFIDDSMPSSYTESNGTSPLIRGNQMMKSHHVVVAELQRQVEEKNGALTSALSSVKMSRTNILNLHGTISALQRAIEEIRGSLRLDVSDLKNFVKEEFWTKMTEVTLIVENINEAMADIHRQMHAEKEHAMCEAKKEATLLENNYLQRLEVENQKLNDAEKQIACYGDRLQEEALRSGDLIYEKEQLESELLIKKELIKSMMLEHELELDSLRNHMRQNMQEKDDEMAALQEVLCSKNNSFDESVKAKLQEQLECLTQEHESRMNEKEKSFCSALEEQYHAHEQELQCLREKSAKDENDLKLHYEIMISEVKQQLKQDLKKEHEESTEKLKMELEKSRANIREENEELMKQKERELKELEEALNTRHKSELESLRSRYKLACSNSTMERLPSDSIMENIYFEKEAINFEDHESIIFELQKRHEEDKISCLKQFMEELEAKLKEAVSEVKVEEAKKYEKEKKDIVTKLQREHDDQLERLKSRYTVENQVSFNEAINRVAKEKDATNDELRCRIAIFVEKQRAIQSLLGRYSSLLSMCEGEMGETLLSQSDSGASCSYKVVHNVNVTKFLSEMKKEIEQNLLVTEYLETSSGSRDHLVIELEKQLRTKEGDYDQLISKFTKLTGCADPQGSKISCLECRERVSILSCNVDDLVLLCYEEKHENFAVFYFGQYLHFLHTDSLQPLDLKIPPGTSGKSWALGVVTDKEFCVTRKPTNRYKVALGTRFYRVRVRTWDREMALMLQRTRRRNQSESSICISPSESQMLPVNFPSSEGEDVRSPGHMSTSTI